ncbi:C45 family peptidase [Singulisphaera acidiphila]|uniref:Penicillin V acylase-like amidase n=1 Tax=Singulisphaera acidiphila (strain ATCC BAA-1392 / DSM 18658 / VKM B-2454 / MOB10) TaxID=886293 RepID=L0D8K5_SINAD|nr:hypothetical protein [Singulisphaera acidiphila]AGA24956.1 hypothetical protein Sinac_0531 [Singulisphaera acidiphila DSM 18658]
MNAKRLVPGLLAALAAFTVQSVEACTIFVITDANRVLFCNNEDWSNPKSRIWFAPEGDGYLGCAYVGFDHGWAQGGLNTKGLAFDWVAGAMGKWKPGTDMKVARGNPSERMLETCATVDEAIAFFRQYRELSFAHAKILVADSSGKSVIIGAKDGKLQIDEGSQCRGFGYGQKTLDKMLPPAPEPTVANGAGILRACLQDGKNGTKYSNIFDLKSGDIHLFPASRLSDGVKLNLAAELTKGEHYYDIPRISEQMTQLPMPLLNNMKRLFLDQFKPIPDTEPGITKRIRVILENLLDGVARAEDYTAEFWTKIKQDEVQAITDFKLLGKIASLTLVERKAEGENHSHRYLVGFKDVMEVEVQLRFVLDQKDRVVLVELEGIEYK